MTEITCEKEGGGKDTKTKLIWEFNKEKFVLFFSSLVRYIFVDDKNEIFVSAHYEKKICRYNLSGILLGEFSIVQKEGYQYRGINRNLKAKLGVSLLYAPVEEGYGNQWGDIEQYELNLDEPSLGRYLDIYR